MPERSPQRVIVNIRGPNAVGKTTLVRELLKAGHPCVEGEELGTFDNVLVRGYRVAPIEPLRLPILVIGTYDDSKYSGCDKIKSADAICQAVTHAAEGTHHVVFEGFRVSKSWERYAALRNALVRAAGVRWMWALLHPPSAQFIIDRSEARREPGSRSIDKDELAAVCRVMNNSRVKALSGFHADTVILDPTRTPEQLLGDVLGRLAEWEGAYA